MLVELGIFHKAKVGFVLVGHKHDHIDKLFIYFAVTLGRKNVGRLPSLTGIIRNTYNPDLVVLTLEDTVDMRRFIMGSHGEER